MNDTISRQGAIGALVEKGQRSKRYKLGEIWELNFDEIREALATVPPAEPQWIPCSERLPEKSDQYYVSGGDKVWICEFLIIPNFTGGWCNDASNPVVQAWMPLPKPYKGDKEWQNLNIQVQK